MPGAEVHDELRQHWQRLVSADPAAAAIDWLGTRLSFAELAQRVALEEEALARLIPPDFAGQAPRVGVQIDDGPNNLVNALALVLGRVPQAILSIHATSAEQSRLEHRLSLSHRIGHAPPVTEGPWTPLGALPSGLRCWRRPVGEPAEPGDPDDPDVFLGTTSGTTSAVPGLVRMRARAVLRPPNPHSPYQLVTAPLLGEGLQHWSARLYKLLTLLRGGRLVIRPVDRAFEAGTIPSHCDGMPMTPSMLRTHLAWDDLRHCPEGFLLISGSDRVPMDLRGAVVASGPVRLGITYATSQSGPLTWLPPEAVLDEPESVGWPIAGVDLEPTGPVRLERDGLRFQEVIAKAPGYSSFNPGDLLAISPSGQVIFGGRSNDVFLFASLLISPHEIEDVLARHPAVEQVVAFGARSERYGGVPMAVVRLGPEQEPTAIVAELEALARSGLGSRRPRRIIPMQEIPRGPSGKPLRRVLSDHFALRS